MHTEFGRKGEKKLSGRNPHLYGDIKEEGHRMGSRVFLGIKGFESYILATSVLGI